MEDLGEKTEQPTGKRRSDARNRGQVAKSIDLAAAIDLVGAAVVLTLLGPTVFYGLLALTRTLLGADAMGVTVSAEQSVDLLMWVAGRALILTAPIVGIMFVIVVISYIVQFGWLWTMQPLEPKWNSLNPVSGFGRLFSKRNLFKTGVSVVKLIVVGAAASYLIAGSFQESAALVMLGTWQAFGVMSGIVAELLAWLLSLMLIIGLIDYAYQRWQLTKDLKMTKQEVKDEHRSSEGDLETKGRRLRMARQMVMQRLRSSVPQADVVVTNPTHFAVALKYDQTRMRAPKVIAKGADELAFRIREIAAASRIPIVERPALARALYWGVDVGREIPAEHYQAVAEILAYVYRLEGRAA